MAFMTRVGKRAGKRGDACRDAARTRVVIGPFERKQMELHHVLDPPFTG
jgi:hypothetical protein